MLLSPPSLPPSLPSLPPPLHSLLTFSQPVSVKPSLYKRCSLKIALFDPIAPPPLRLPILPPSLPPSLPAEDTPYVEGSFHVKLVLSQDFPNSPPRGFFLTKIYHPNVSSTGDICVNTLKKDWTPTTTLVHVLQVSNILPPFRSPSLPPSLLLAGFLLEGDLSPQCEQHGGHLCENAEGGLDAHDDFGACAAGREGGREGRRGGSAFVSFPPFWQVIRCLLIVPSPKVNDKAGKQFMIFYKNQKKQPSPFLPPLPPSLPSTR